MIVCYSRCLICGRRTPHEACHKHSLAMGGGKNWPNGSGDSFSRNMERMWKRHFNDEPEVCNDGAACPASDDYDIAAGAPTE